MVYEAIRSIKIIFTSTFVISIKILVVCVSLFWALFPIAIVVIQYSASVELAGVVARWALPFSTAGLLFSSPIFSRAAHELRLCRQPS